MSLEELEAEAGREDRFRCPFSTLSEATDGSSVREFLRLGVLDFSMISLGSLLCPETMAAFASSSVKNTEDRNEVWKCLLYMSTGRNEVSKRILNIPFWLKSLCVQQGPYPTW